MRVPQRKPGQYSNIPKDPLITQERYDELQKKLEGLKRAHKKQVPEVKRLAEMGDFSENAAYQIAKWRMRSLMYRIDEISGFLKTAEIIQKPQGDKIKVGHTVTIASADKTYTYTILGSTQTDPSNGKISYQSKLGEALIGQTVGDIIKLETPSTTIEYEIIEIN